MALIVGLAFPSQLSFLGLSNVTDFNAGEYAGFFDRSRTVEDSVVAFYLEANSITNEHLKLLTSDDEGQAQARTLVPPQDPADCSALNVSTYCLASRLESLLYAFEIRLQNFSDDVDVSRLPREDLEEAVALSISRQNLIDDEITFARDTLDLSLSVYNEAQLVYPVHREFVLLQENLIDYRRGLSQLRGELERYPGRFHDATTLSCK